MKTVLFAIPQEGFTQADEFEDRVISLLRVGSREFVDAQKKSCNYRDGLFKMAQQIRPDCIVINENLIGPGNLLEIVKDIRTELPDVLIVMLIKDQRVIGDAFLANLTINGVYNWIPSPWRPEAISEALISPKKLKDVESYIPRVNDSGTAFETKVVERIEDKIDDIPDLLANTTSNAVRINGINDMPDENVNTQVAYHKVMSGGFGFGGTLKPKKAVSSQPIQPTVEAKPKEIVKEPVKEVRQEPIQSAMPKTVEEDQELQEMLRKRREERRKAFEKKFAEEKLEKEAVSEKPVLQTPKPEIKKPSLQERMDAFRKADELNENEDKKVPAKKAEAKKDNPKPQEVKLESEASVHETLEEMDFKPKYNKILFIRALPLTSLLPIHLVKKIGDKAVLVDFNKESNLEEYFPVVKTTIKEAKMPQKEYIIGDVVAGNGVESVAKRFDHVVAVLPEDPFVIKTFIKRYPNLCDGVVLERSNAPFKDKKSIIGMFGEDGYVASIRTEKYEKALAKAVLNKTLLMNSPEYAESIEFFLKNISKEASE